MTEEHKPKEIETDWRCKECRSPLIDTGTGFSVCPEGHGKLLPQMPARIRVRNHALIAFKGEIAQVTQVTDGSWMFDVGGPRYTIKEKLTGRKADKYPADFQPLDRIGLDGDKVYWLTPKVQDADTEH